MTTNVISMASFTGHRTTRHGARPLSLGPSVVPFASPEADARALLVTWLALTEALTSHRLTHRVAEQAETAALKRFNAAKRGKAHPDLQTRLLQEFWDASAARKALGKSPPSAWETGTALDEALSLLPATVGNRIVTDLTSVQAGRIGRTASALRRRRPRVQVAV